MKVGVDAKWIFSGNISGRLFIRNVLPELIALEPDFEWHIFLNAKERKHVLPFKGKNVKTHYVWAGLNMISNLFVIPRYAKKLKLDTVFFQTFSPKMKSTKSVVFIHDILHSVFPQYFTWTERIYFKPKKWTLPHASRIITTTEYVKQELRKHRFSLADQPIDLAPSGVTNVYKPLREHNEKLLQQVKSKYNLPDSYVLYVGRINARKNIENLIRAIRIIKNKNISLVIAGEKNWKAPSLKQFLKDSELRARIHFTGAVTDEELSCIYALSKAFCFPSFAEGMGLPPLEAMASGVPVIVSNTTSMPGVCGNAALYADPQDPASIAEKINLLLEDQYIYDQKVREGLEWSKNFTWSYTAKCIMQSILASTNKS